MQRTHPQKFARPWFVLTGAPLAWAFGITMAWPVRWQGWALLIAYGLATGSALYRLFPQHWGIALASVVLLTGALAVVVESRTDQSDEAAA